MISLSNTIVCRGVFILDVQVASYMRLQLVSLTYLYFQLWHPYILRVSLS